jgi:hypothetical protein
MPLGCALAFPLDGKSMDRKEQGTQINGLALRHDVIM